MRSKNPLIKHLIGAAAVFALSAATSSAALILSSIYDGESSTPKGVEIYVTSSGSYDGWTVNLEFNDNVGFSVGYTFDATSYSAGDFIYLTSTAGDPTITGAGGIIIADGSFNMNGNDRVRISDGATAVDQFGVSGTNGSGEPWEYTDSFATRNSGTTANGTFSLGDWTVRPINTLDSGNAPLAAALGTYVVPEPGAFALLSITGLLYIARRRR